MCDVFVAGFGMKDDTRLQTVHRHLAGLAHVHVHAPVQYDEGLRTIVHVPAIRLSVQWMRTVASSTAITSMASQGLDPT